MRSLQKPCGKGRSPPRVALSNRDSNWRPQRGAQLGHVPGSTADSDSLQGTAPQLVLLQESPLKVWGVNSASPHFPRSEFHSASLKLAESIKVKDLFAQPTLEKFMRGHFSDKSESFSKVTKPSGGRTKRFSLGAHLRGLLLFLPLGNRIQSVKGGTNRVSKSMLWSTA